ncbi:hypothetical protein BDR26DRAFT_900015 [Obelidium mucronatum]|nr:hypothetical protein BDR26DRAFT_900015 [Obelidium mucronatum]
MQHDLVLARNEQFNQLGLGIVRNGFGSSETEHKFGKGLTWVGWGGAGGSVAFMNREYGISIAYTMNFCHLQSVGDIRVWRILDELVRILKESDPERFHRVSADGQFLHSS